MMENKGYYAITQYGYTVYGVGRTKLGALRHANQYLSEKMTLKEIEDNNPAEKVFGEMYLVRCSKKLYDDVRDFGGDVSCELTQTRYLDISERV